MRDHSEKRRAGGPNPSALFAFYIQARYTKKKQKLWKNTFCSRRTMADYTEKLTDAQAMSFIDQVGSVFKNLPHLPATVIEFLVKVSPWLALVGGVLGLIAGPVVGVLGSLSSVLTLSPYLMVMTLVSVALLIINSILLLMAFSPLRRHEMRGWVFLFWSEMLRAVDVILSIVQGQTNSIVGTVIGFAISLYILFEIRSSYSSSSKSKATKKA